MSILNELERTINEKSLNNTEFSKQVIQDFKNSIDWGNETMRYEYVFHPDGKTEEEIDDEYDSDDDLYNSEEFKEWLNGYVEEKYYDIVYELAQYIDNGYVNIYRMMSIENDYIKHLESQGKHLGIYWSYVKDAAEAHWGGSGENILITSIVKDESINWSDTIVLNMVPSTGENEKEIRLFKGTPLKILGIETDNDELDISPIKNKIFYA